MAEIDPCLDQQRWTLKRELYMELLHSLYSEKEAIFKLSDEEKKPVPTAPHILALRDKFIEENRAQSLAAIKRISKVRGVAGVLLTDEAQKALDEIALAWYLSPREQDLSAGDSTIESATCGRETVSDVVRELVDEYLTAKYKLTKSTCFWSSHVAPAKFHRLGSMCKAHPLDITQRWGAEEPGVFPTEL